MQIVIVNLHYGNANSVFFSLLVFLYLKNILWNSKCESANDPKNK